MSQRESSVPQRVEVNMTPMIDVVFQLLTFFLMTFKVAVAEGDFNVKMPLGIGDGPRNLSPIKIRLEALPDGTLNQLRIHGHELGGGPAAFQALHQEVRGHVGGAGALAGQLEVEIDADSQLHYIHVVNAISAVSGYVDPATGTVFKLIEKVKFTPPKGP